MSKNNFFVWPMLGVTALLFFLNAGCDKQNAQDALNKAENTAENLAKDLSQGTKDLMNQGQKMAAELGEKAMGFIAPLKEQFGNLEGLKNSPQQLKEAVAGLIQSIEGKAESLGLPDAMNAALNGIKTKLVALRDYLAGQVEQAKVDEHIKGIMDSVKSGLGG